MLKNRYLIAYSVILVLLVIGTFVNLASVDKVTELESYWVKPLPSTAGVSIYERLDSKDRLKCNLTTVSVIVERMEQDGYELTMDRSTPGVLDTTLEKDGEIYRLLYNRLTRDFLCISSPLTNNYVPLTYLYE
jgi:hypothetical protein